MSSFMAAPPQGSGYRGTNRAKGMSHMKAKLMEAGATKEAVAVVPKSEMDRIKELMTGGGGENARRQANIEDKKKLMELSAAKKEKMITFDKERARIGLAQTPEEMAAEAKRGEDIKMARRLQDETNDEVKVMNKVMLYSKCVTIRDAQTEEKKQIKEEKAQQEKKLDMIMEMERLKALKMYEEREQKRIEDRRKGAMVIRAQITEREQERMRQLELKAQEQEAMLRHIEKMKEEDRKEAERKIAASKRLMEDVALANGEQIKLKSRQRETEVEEERQIIAYLKEKEIREQAIQDEAERVRAEKERETARLRSLQEKAQDKQAELDALRAKRAQEAYEREWRRKEKIEAERLERINAELAVARETQKREKEALLAEQAIVESEEFDRVVAVQRAGDKLEVEKRALEQARRNKHQMELKQQIASIEEEKKKQRHEFLAEGVKLKKEREAHAVKMERIRQAKLAELTDMGIPAKYRQELLRKRDTEPLRPAK